MKAFEGGLSSRDCGGKRNKNNLQLNSFSLKIFFPVQTPNFMIFINFKVLANS